MKGAISDLTKNLQLLERELKSEMIEINKLSNEIVSLDDQVMICSIQASSL